MPRPGRVLITGGAGFLGSHLARRLRTLGVEVRLLDDLSGAPEGNLPRELAPELLFRGDVRDEALLRRAVRDCEAVVHLADRPVSANDPTEGFGVNTQGTLALMRACQDLKVPRVVLASSCSVYGSTGAPPLSEGRPPGPVSLVGASKASAEALVRVFAEQGALHAVVLRFFHVYGPGRITSRTPGVLALFGREVASGRPPQVHGSGELLRDFVHVEDGVEALRLALERKVANWTVANVGTGVGTSLRTAAEAVAAALGRLDLEPVSVDPPPGPSVNAFADLRAARASLGFSPKIGLVEGLQRKDFHLPLPPSSGGHEGTTSTAVP
ncbi:MAG: NAD-dependent epimerase/dehydratase family protein [Euryarchaeota archaeon]|nr:NAD-dependent epimerase/dehydratase family protein [Euryarchaeota archaeon]MDE1836393.1 NAD-dependent epimerase/dehydratase family protein [Euryarchaeota archaeon]MDE1881672.1 NAD-dependent epimerase/dehydratase family protein [Euryarchaeota archaeon]MDE2044141.1 NAD-dependent epimerase/dehydratase family protein [Thermoplasmata archaeon]